MAPTLFREAAILQHGDVRGYMVRPAGIEGKLPAVVVVHENRGLNPYTENVARRLAKEGFLALAPDGLSSVGGYPGNDAAAVAYPELGAAVPYYGRQPTAADVPKIQAPLLLHYAALDARVNEGWPAYEAALQAHGKTYAAYIYDGANHGFHNDSTPRYDAAMAELSWERTIAHFKQHLA